MVDDAKSEEVDEGLYLGWMVGWAYVAILNVLYDPDEAFREAGASPRQDAPPAARPPSARNYPVRPSRRDSQSAVVGAVETYLAVLEKLNEDSLKRIIEEMEALLVIARPRKEGSAQITHNGGLAPAAPDAEPGDPKRGISQAQFETNHEVVLGALRASYPNGTHAALFAESICRIAYPPAPDDETTPQLADVEEHLENLSRELKQLRHCVPEGAYYVVSHALKRLDAEQRWLAQDERRRRRKLLTSTSLKDLQRVWAGLLLQRVEAKDFLGFWDKALANSMYVAALLAIAYLALNVTLSAYHLFYGYFEIQAGTAKGDLAQFSYDFITKSAEVLAVFGVPLASAYGGAGAILRRFRSWVLLRRVSSGALSRKNVDSTKASWFELKIYGMKRAMEAFFS